MTAPHPPTPPDPFAPRRLHHLGDETRAVEAAADAADRALHLALDRYRNGAVSYLEVVAAQTGVLSARRQALALRARCLTASVALIRALGGDWSGEVDRTTSPAAPHETRLPSRGGKLPARGIAAEVDPPAGH